MDESDARRVQAQVAEQMTQQGEAGDEDNVVAHPAKLLRIASMIRELLEEARQTSVDEAGRKRLATIYQRSVSELQSALSPELLQELEELMPPVEEVPSASEIRVAQAQLLGWLEGLFHGIQAALWAQHMQAQAALEEMRRRGLPAGAQPGRRPEQPQQPGTPGQYL
ncbi:MAG TPA: proteasome activator [Actinomycetota bacterium]|nr:proteasome activator [Actinomycetota bacterium]